MLLVMHRPNDSRRCTLSRRVLRRRGGKILSIDGDRPVCGRCLTAQSRGGLGDMGSGGPWSPAVDVERPQVESHDIYERCRRTECSRSTRSSRAALAVYQGNRSQAQVAERTERRAGVCPRARRRFFVARRSSSTPSGSITRYSRGEREFCSGATVDGRKDATGTEGAAALPWH